MALLLLSLPAPALVFVGRGNITPMRRLRTVPRMDVAEVVDAVAEAVAPAADAPAAGVTPAIEAVTPAIEAVTPVVEMPAQVAPDVFVDTGSKLAAMAESFSAAIFGESFTEIAGSNWQQVAGSNEYLPLIAAFTVLPILSFLGYILIDGVTGLFRMASGTKSGIIVTSGPLAAEEDLYASVWKDDASFSDALSAWPAILQVKRELEAMPAEEARRIKLETGTNWQPRTTTAGDGTFWNDAREGFMFFQGPSPKTAVQEGLPSFFSQDNFRDVQVPKTLLVS